MPRFEELFAGAQRDPEPTGSPFLSFDLADKLQQLRTEDHPWQAGRNARILVKYPNLRILLVGFRQGTHMAEHRAAGPISIHIVTGHILVRAAGKPLALREGQLLALEAEVPHDLEALAESAVLVTISWPGAKG